jgi:hypothetical protein
MWRYRAYVRKGNRNVVEEWLADYGGDAHAKLRAKFVTRATYLQHQSQGSWKEPHFHHLRGGIGAMGFEWKNVVHRPLGFFGPQRMEFTFLLFAKERGDEYLPRGCIDDAIARMGLVRSGVATATEWRPSKC